MSTATRTIEELANQDYKYGFVTDIEAETVPAGLDEDVIRLISAKKSEPEWLLDWRLEGLPRLEGDDRSPRWANICGTSRSTTSRSSTTRRPGRRPA